MLHCIVFSRYNIVPCRVIYWMLPVLCYNAAMNAKTFWFIFANDIIFLLLAAQPCRELLSCVPGMEQVWLQEEITILSKDFKESTDTAKFLVDFQKSWCILCKQQDLSCKTSAFTKTYMKQNLLHHVEMIAQRGTGTLLELFEGSGL